MHASRFSLKWANTHLLMHHFVTEERFCPMEICFMRPLRIKFLLFNWDFEYSWVLSLRILLCFYLSLISFNWGVEDGTTIWVRWLGCRIINCNCISVDVQSCLMNVVDINLFQQSLFIAGWNKVMLVVLGRKYSWSFLFILNILFEES